MKIECPEGSGNYLNIYWGANGDLQIGMECKDCTGFKFSGGVILFGRGKGELSPPIQKELLDALAKFASA
jgi:hypothetical protein